MTVHNAEVKEAQKLRLWWIPQVPMKSFYVEVDTVAEGVKLLDTLANYDLFQYENNVKPDYANAGGLSVWDEDERDWLDWGIEIKDAEGNAVDYFHDPVEYLEYIAEQNKTK